MRPVADHVAAAIALARRPRVERLPLGEALGRVLAAPVTALADVPAFDNSAMDGYAVRVAEVTRGGVLRVSLDVPAGAAPGVLAAGTAARIMTGAPIPAGADAIVPRESTDDGLASVRIGVAPAPGDYVRRAAEDARAGDLVLGPGAILGPAQLAAAAGAGWPELEVAARPRVLVVSTGDELRRPGEPLAPGQIVDSNTTLLAALVAQAGGEVARTSLLGDDPDGFVAGLGDLGDIDLILTAGGVSVGAYDVVKAALAPLGVEFVRVAMQPGKPQGLGVLDGVAVACLPGNPVSVAASFTAFVEPMIRTSLGLAPRVREASVALDVWSSPPGREQWTPVVVESAGVRPATAGGSRSHLGLSLAAADAWAIVPPDVERVERGDSVGLMRFLA